MTTATRHTSQTAARGVALYATMLRLRRFEEKAGMLYALGTLATPCPLGIGQEAAIAGIVAALAPDDGLLALEERPALALALGRAPAAVFQSLVRARHEESDPALLVHTQAAPLGHASSLAQACAALVSIGGLAVVIGKDGAAATAAAGALKDHPVLPVVITPRDAADPPDPWPAAWDVREIDGTDPTGVAEAMTAARAQTRSGRGRPAVLVRTPPYVGHARAAGARAPARRDVPDPLVMWRRALLAGGRASEADLLSVEASVRDEIAVAGRALALGCGET